MVRGRYRKLAAGEFLLETLVIGLEALVLEIHAVAIVGVDGRLQFVGRFGEKRVASKSTRFSGSDSTMLGLARGRIEAAPAR